MPLSTLYDAVRVCLALAPWAFLALVPEPNVTIVAAAAFTTLASSSFLIERRRAAFGLSKGADRLRIVLSFVSPLGVILLGLKVYGVIG